MAITHQPRRPHPRESRVRSALRRRSVRAFAAAAILGGVAVAVTLHSAVGVAEGEPDSRAEFVVSGGGAPPTERPELQDAREPLSADEIGYAIHLATTNPALPADAADVRGVAGLEVLYVDLPAVDAQPRTRQARVVAYDYTADATISVTVDLKDGTVADTRRASRVQPPPSADEIEEAIELAVASDPPLRFQTEFEASEGVPLIRSDQVGYSGGAFVFDGTTEGGQACGAERCVQLLVRTPGGTYLDTTDFVVNLSGRTIVTLGG